MVDLDFKKSSDGRTWSATTTLSTLKDYVLPNYAGNGINFQTIKEREIAKEAKEKLFYKMNKVLDHQVQLVQWVLIQKQ